MITIMFNHNPQYVVPIEYYNRDTRFCLGAAESSSEILFKPTNGNLETLTQIGMNPITSITLIDDEMPDNENVVYELDEINAHIAFVTEHVGEGMVDCRFDMSFTPLPEFLSQVENEEEE